MKRKAFSPLEEAADSGISQSPAIEGAATVFAAASALSSWRVARKLYSALLPRFCERTLPTSLPSCRVAVMVVR